MAQGDLDLYATLCVGISLALLAWAMVGLARAAERHGRGLRLAAPLALAAGLRLACIALFAGVPALRSFRGEDEGLFLRLADQLLEDPSALGPLPQALIGNLHVATFAAVDWLFGSPTTDLHLRIGQVVFTVAAITVLAVTVSQLSGPKAGRLAAFLLAMEPTGIFFTSILHKEALVMLGEALTVAGCVRFWRSRDPRALLVLAGGVILAGMVRPYVGAALALGALIVVCLATFRRLSTRQLRAQFAGMCLGITLVLGLAISSQVPKVLDRLQVSQNANSSNASANLSLPPVDVSSLTALPFGIVQRTFDLLSRPRPWQAMNPSQLLGGAGTVTTWLLLAVGVAAVLRRWRFALASLLPVALIASSVMAAYALSTGNAGTGARYRTHVLALIIVLTVAAAAGPRQTSSSKCEL